MLDASSKVARRRAGLHMQEDSGPQATAATITLDTCLPSRTLCLASSMRLKCRRGSHSLSAASHGAAKSQAELATALQASSVLAEDVTRMTSCVEGRCGLDGGATASLEG